ncbi:agamous-like MADS-box protein MADS2 [Cornus florida]|uniref:agamous-like MADS-box protein MADS2 n=1 Tax=Cornus florida TaxID=4283 RepID=UPI00289E588B|nr:agamous-like MADS-box protein MADS2 [Cornus florida]
MGRGKVELKRIENKINRQVTFAKRRNGLLKKAYELSVLCDAEVALIIFSNRGKLYEFCSTSSGMAKTLERYQRCSYGALEANQPDMDTQGMYQQYLRLKGRVEVLQQSQRHFLGEDLGPLNTKELEQLEGQLEKSLKQIRSTKTQYMLDQLSDLEKKEQALLEVNIALKKKLGENAEAPQSSWEAGEHNASYRCHPAAHSEPFLEPLECNNTPQVGFNFTAQHQLNVGSSTQAADRIFPGWML